jgi:c-di-GMP-binding flagellar brake protein YcgR
MTDPRERRKDARTDARLRAGVRREADGDTLAVTTLNIGAGGVYVEVPRFIEPLTKLQITIDLPGPKGAARIETQAIVVRTDPDEQKPDVTRYEVACAFLGMPEADRQAIRRWVLAQGSQVAPRT